MPQEELELWLTGNSADVPGDPVKAHVRWTKLKEYILRSDPSCPRRLRGERDHRRVIECVTNHNRSNLEHNEAIQRQVDADSARLSVSYRLASEERVRREILEADIRGRLSRLLLPPPRLADNSY